MLFSSAAIILASAGLIDARSLAHRHLDNHEIARRATTNSDATGSTGTTLVANAIQSGSFVDGSQEIGAAEVGQAKSATSTNNFINNCSGKTLTNGLQITTGSCNGIPMGDIPAKTAMVSSIITFPEFGTSSVQSDTTFNITVAMTNMVTGSFTNADATYYAAPQQLSGGVVVGHTHVTVQDLGKSLNPTTPLDPTQFAFFKGINSAANAEGVLTATVTGGLPAGNYRVCTMASASNHQPVLMPVAQRGTADDCTKFTVSGSGTTANAASNDGSAGIAAAAAAASAVANGAGNPAPDTSAASTSAATKASNNKGSSGSTTTKAGKGNAAASSTSTTEAANNKETASSTTTKAAKGKGAAKATATPNSVGTANTASAQSDKGKGNIAAGSSEVTEITVVEFVTFFNFASSKGGVAPSVSKNGESFLVLDETFDDLPSAASAACGHQYTSCVSFAGPLFSVDECVTQQDTCNSAASAATTTSAAPATLTASVTVAATQTVSIASESGVSVLSTLTSSTTISASAIAAAATTPAAVADDAAAAASTGASSITTSSAAAVTQAASPSKAAKSSGVKFSNTTSTATSSAAAATSVSTTSDAAALGGIVAPAVTNSGDSARPFEVNGNTFVNEAAAKQRSCDIQFNACADAFNAGTATGFTIADCTAQETTCNSS